MAGWPLGADPGAPGSAGAGGRRALRRPRASAPGVGALGGARVDARDDGDDPEPGTERRHRRGAGGPVGQRALRVGLLPPVHHDVLGRGAGHQARGLRRIPRRREGPARRGRRRRCPGRRAAEAREDLPGRDRNPHGRPVPAGRARPAGPRHRCGVRLLVRQEGDGVPAHPRHPGGLGHRGDRHDDGVRQPRRGLRHGCGLHARPALRRIALLRRVPAERPGRGRGGGDPHPAPDRGPARADAGDLRRAPRHRHPARAPLQGHAGHRVHDPGGEALPPPDARRQAIGPRGGAGGGGPRAGARHRSAHRDPPGQPDGGERGDPPGVRRPREGGGHRRRPAPRPRAGGGPRRRGGARRLRCRPGGGVGQGRPAGDPGAPGDLARGRGGHVRRRGHRHIPGWPHLARGGGGGGHGQGVRRGGRGPRGRRDAAPLRGWWAHGTGGRRHLRRRRDRRGHPGRRHDGCRPAGRGDEDAARMGGLLPEGRSRRPRQCRHPGRCGAGAGLRGGGHRSRAHRAHVLRGRPHRDRPRDDHGARPGDPPRRPRSAPAATARGLPRHLPGHGRLAGDDPAARSAAPRVPSELEGIQGDGRAEEPARGPRDRIPRSSGGSRR